jgi:alpha-N-acetylglucosamine transferase
MVTESLDDEARDALASEGCILRDVNPLLPPAERQLDYASPRFAHTWTKLRAWELKEVDRAVFLDGDMLVLRSMDELFDLQLPAGGIAACRACLCNPDHNPTYPAHWIPENCPYTFNETARELLLASPRDYLNAGLFVFEPNPLVFDAIAARLNALPDGASAPFSDQDLINAHFSNNWIILPYIYNALKTLSKSHSNMWSLKAIKNIHYIFDKPWEQFARSPDDPYADLNELWWKFWQHGGETRRS